MQAALFCLMTTAKQTLADTKVNASTGATLPADEGTVIFTVLNVIVWGGVAGVCIITIAGGCKNFLKKCGCFKETPEQLRRVERQSQNEPTEDRSTEDGEDPFEGWYYAHEDSP